MPGMSLGGHSSDGWAQARGCGADARSVRIALAASLVILSLALPTAQAAAAETRIVVGRDPGLTVAERADIRADAGVDLLRTSRLANTELVVTDDPASALARLRRDPDVRYAEVERVRRAFTNDEWFTEQWGLAAMDVPEAWSTGASGDQVTVAVVDSGVAPAHRDLVRAVAAGSRGFVGAGDTGTADGDGHGTHVAGIIAAERDNTVGITGVAPNARLMVLRALDDAGSGGDLDIAEAFDYAGDLGVPIVNASLGGEGASDVLDDAIMSHPNTLYVIAAGNNGADNDPETRTIYPCEVPAPNVICVGASTQADVPAGFSNFGATSVDLFAPGDAIYSTFPLDGYAAMSGTSMATPMVAAEAALVLDAAPELTTSQLKAVLLTGVDQKDAYAGRSVTGGRANAALALTEAGHPPPSDADADGIPDAGDACPIVAGPGTAAGCPVNVTPTPPPATTTPTATVAPTADRDGDGRSDSLDACPAEPAHSADGCPLPGVRALSVAVAKRTRRATATVRPDRPATVGIRIERRTCKVVATRNKCRWTTVASHARVTTGAPVRLVRRLARGSHRVTVTLTSSAGRARPVTKAFRVR
jgi:thermitase